MMKLIYYEGNKFRLKLLKLTCHVSVFVVRGCTYFYSSALVPSFTFQSITLFLRFVVPCIFSHSNKTPN